MARTRRYYRGNRPYEITIRTRQGRPLPPWDLINLLIRSAVARTQRDQKVTLCHYVWMGNHAHFLVVLKDAEQCRKFYMEIQRKITGYLKRLLGVEQLFLWEGQPSVSEILDVEKVIDRIVYFYCNPAHAELETSIERYPGVSTWKAAQTGGTHSEEVPWVRFPAVKKLFSHKLSRRQDQFLTAKLLQATKEKHALTVEPDAWLSCFGITDAAVIKETRELIMSKVSDKEHELDLVRTKTGKKVLGAERLRGASIAQEHVPRKKERRIFVLASDTSLRVSYIQMVKALATKCAELYQLAKAGAVHLLWPPGVFRPPLPPIASAVGSWQ